MKQLYYIINTLIILLGTLYINSNASQKHTLKNISTVAVVIRQSSDIAVIDGFEPDGLSKLIEKRLAESRIDTVRYKDWMNNIGGSYLYIKVIPSKSYSGESYAVYIEIELYQAVVLIKSRVEENKVVHGNTWSVGKLLNCKTEYLNSCISSTVLELTDMFIKNYEEANSTK